MDDDERRRHERFETELSVDYASGETFLFASIGNISEMGIFLRSADPLPVGTALRMRFASGAPFELSGIVVWTNPVRLSADNPNPGMGVAFIDLERPQREALVQLVRTIAYVNPPPRN